MCARRRQTQPSAKLHRRHDLSPKQLDDELAQSIEGILQETGLPPSALKLEVTESAVLENTQAATQLLERLKQKGVRASLDDFGTGYSSFSYLHQLPYDTLKIDRSFVSSMGDKEGEGDIEATRLEPGALAALIGLVDAGRVTPQSARDVLRELAEQGGDPEALIRERGLEAVSDSGVLESAGCEVQNAEDGEEALTAAFEFQPEIVFLDINLPKQFGWLVCAKLKLTEPSPQVVLITGLVSDDLNSFSEFVKAGDVLQKPFSAEDVLRFIPGVLT